MEYFKNFDLKKMFFRVITVGYTAFLAGFSKDYVASPDLAHAVQAGVALMWQGLWAGFGIDQLIFHNTKS